MLKAINNSLTAFLSAASKELPFPRITSTASVKHSSSIRFFSVSFRTRGFIVAPALSLYSFSSCVQKEWIVLMLAVSISPRALAAASMPFWEASSRSVRSLSFIFCAASLVKVITRNCEIDASGCLISVCLIFSTMTVVLPEPAAAETRIFWFCASMAAC